MDSVSIPAAHLQAVRAFLGDEFSQWETAFSLPAPVSIRINPLKWKDEMPGDPVPWSQTGFYLPERPFFTHDPLFHAGAYYVQEASSMSLEQVYRNFLPADEPVHALDLCAAPGGKSTHLLSLLGENSLLVSNEVIRSRANILAENISKWGRDQCIVTNADPERFAALPGFFDLVLADLPCSGEGLFRRDPEAAGEWSEANVELCSMRQRRIVLDAWPALKTGGLLVYSTCTFNTAENESNLAWLHTQCGFESLRVPFPAGSGIMETEHEGIFGYRFFPHRVKGEGFFFSLLRKTDETANTGRLKSNLVHATNKEKEAVKNFLQSPADFDFFNHNQRIIALRKTIALPMQHIAQQLHTVQAGIVLADAAKGLKPDHQLALYTGLNRNAFPGVKLDKDQALDYLAKEDVKISGNEKGIALVSFGDIPLGWINRLGNRSNNLYPKEWRIRKR